MAFGPAETADVHRKRRRWWLWLLGLCLIGVAAYGLRPRLGLTNGRSRSGCCRSAGLRRRL